MYDQALLDSFSFLLKQHVYSIHAATLLNEADYNVWIIVTYDKIIICNKYVTRLLKEYFVNYDELSFIQATAYGFDQIRFNCCKATFQIIDAIEFLNSIKIQYFIYWHLEHGKYKTIQIKYIDTIESSTELLIFNPWKNYRLHFIGGYLFFIIDNFQQNSFLPNMNDYMSFKNDQGCYFIITIDTNTETTKNETITSQLHQITSQLMVSINGFVMLEQMQCYKRANYYNDYASWNAVLQINQSSNAWIYIIVAERDYIPPLHANKHFIKLLYIVPNDIMKNQDDNYLKNLEIIKELYDSIGHPTINNKLFSIVIECYCDTLSLNVDSLDYVAKHYSIFPYMHDITLFILNIIIIKILGDIYRINISEAAILWLENHLERTKAYAKKLFDAYFEDDYNVSLKAFISDFIFNFDSQLYFGINTPKNTKITDDDKIMLNLYAAKIADYMYHIMEVFNDYASTNVFNSIIGECVKSNNKMLLLTLIPFIKFIFHVRSNKFNDQLNLDYPFFELFSHSLTQINQKYVNNLAYANVLENDNLNYLSDIDILLEYNNKNKEIMEGTNKSKLNVAYILLLSAQTSINVKLKQLGMIINYFEADSITIQDYKLMQNIIAKYVQSNNNEIINNEQIIFLLFNIIHKLFKLNIINDKLNLYTIRIIKNLENYSKNTKLIIIKYIQLFMNNITMKQKLFYCDLVNILMNYIHNFCLYSHNSTYVYVVRICYILASFSSIEECWKYYTGRLPILDHFLYIYENVDLTADTILINYMLKCFIILIQKDRRLTIRIGLHVIDGIMLYLIQTKSEELGKTCCYLLYELLLDYRIVDRINKTDFITYTKNHLQSVWVNQTSIYDRFCEVIDSYKEVLIFN